MSLFSFLAGHMHKSLLTMSLFFCIPGHKRQEKQYMSHCRRRMGHNTKNYSICPTVSKERDITGQKFSICPQTKKSPFLISCNTKSRQLSTTSVLQHLFAHHKIPQKGAGCPTPLPVAIINFTKITVTEKVHPDWTDLPVQA